MQWLGPQAQAVVLDAYRSADIFVLPSRVSADGDRDGLPNVLLEAQSQRVACLSTAVSGIPELIVDGVTGMLIEPRSPDALAHALSRLIGDPSLRRTLGNAGFERTTTALFAAGRRRCPRRTICREPRRAMRIAFYAPLKSPAHPVPSGDRRIARALLQALALGGHETMLVSSFRSFDATR